MSDNDQIRLENGCYVIPQKKLNTFFKVMTVYVEVLDCFPREEMQKAFREKMKSHNVSDKDEKEFVSLLCDLLKLELSN